MNNPETLAAEEKNSDASLPSLPTNLSYATGQLAISVFFQVSSLILLPFMTSVLAIPAVLAGAAIMIPKTSAIFMDPMFGLLSERLSPKWRQRRPFILGGGVVLALCILIVFRPPSFSDPLVLCVFIFLCLFAANAALSALTVAYLAAANDIAKSPRARTLLSSWRVTFHMGGVLVGGLAPAAIDLFGGGRVGYSSMAIALSSFCLCAVLFNYHGLRKIKVSEQQTKYASVRDLWLVVSKPSYFINLTHIYSLKYFANGIQYSATAYFTIYILGGGLPLLTGLVVTMTISALLSQPIWIKVAALLGRRRTFMIATAGIGASFLSFGALSSGQYTAAYAISMAQGIFAGGGALMSWSLFLESIDMYREQTGIARPELLSGVWSAVEKASFAIGVFCFGGVLQLVGFISSNTTDVEQPASAIFGIQMGMAVLPCIGMALTLLLIYVKLDKTVD